MLAYTNEATCPGTQMCMRFEWVIQTGWGLPISVERRWCLRAHRPSKERWIKQKCTPHPPPPASLSTWRWSVFHFLNITPACTHPGSKMLRPFQRLLAFWRKCPLCSVFTLTGSSFPYPPSFHLLRGSGRTGEHFSHGSPFPAWLGACSFLEKAKLIFACSSDSQPLNCG